MSSPLARVLGAGLGFFGLALLGLALGREYGNVAPVWPASAFMLGVVLRAPARELGVAAAGGPHGALGADVQPRRPGPGHRLRRLRRVRGRGDRARGAGARSRPHARGPPRGGAYDLDHRLRRADGGGLHVHSEATVERDEAGRAVAVLGVVHDVTDRWQAEERYRDLYDNTPVMMHSIDRQGRLVGVNQHWLDTMGYARHEVLGRPSVDFLTAESRRVAEEVALPAFRRDGRVENFPYQMIRKDGAILDVRLSATSERDVDGSFLRSRASLLDVTEQLRAECALQRQQEDLERTVAARTRALVEANTSLEEEIARRRRAEAQLRASEERFDLAMQGAADGLWDWDIVGDRVYYSPRWKSMLGLAPEEVGCSREDWSARVHPDDLDGALQAVQACLVDPSRRLEITHRMRHKSGRYVWVLSRGMVVADAEGRPARLIGTHADLTERVAMEAELQRRERELERTFEQAPIGAAVVDLEYRFRRVNRELCRMTGLAPEALIGRRFTELTHPDDAELELDRARLLERRALDGYEMDKRYLRGDGDGGVVWASLSVRLIRDDAGEPLYFLPMMIDITARRHAEEALRRSLEEKEVLVREVHHRVKNNLQVISSLLALQADRTAGPEARAALQESRHRVYAIALVHNLVHRSPDLSRIDLGAYLPALAREVVAAQGGGVALEVDTECVTVDVERAIPCGQVVNELVSNALEHAFPQEPGRIRLEVRRTAANRLRIAVEDDGVGLPPGLDWRRTDSLGLQLVDSLAAQLHGTARVEGVRPGTRFVLELPAEDVPRTQTLQAAS